MKETLRPEPTINYQAAAQSIVQDRNDITAVTGELGLNVVDQVFVPMRLNMAGGPFMYGVSPNVYLNLIPGLAQAVEEVYSTPKTPAYPVDAFMADPNGRRVPLNVKVIQQNHRPPGHPAESAVHQTSFVKELKRREQQVVADFIASDPRSEDFLDQRLLASGRRKREINGQMVDVFYASVIPWRTARDYHRTQLLFSHDIQNRDLYHQGNHVGKVYQIQLPDIGFSRPAYERMMTYPVVQ